MKNKLLIKIIAYTLAISMLILLVPNKVKAADSATLQLVLSKASLKAGDTLDAYIYVKGGKINALVGDLVYTKTNYQTLTRDNIKISDQLTNSASYGNWGITGFNETTGILYLEEDNYTFCQFDTDTLMAKITFTATVDVPDTTGMQLKNVYLTASEDQISVPLVSSTVQGQSTALYIKSKAYTLNTTSFSTSYNIGTDKEYQDGDLYISNIPDKMTVANFVKNIDTNGTVSILDSNNQVVDSTKYIGSGMQLVVTNSSKTVKLTAIVAGDLDGDGKSSITDLSRMNQAINKSVTLSATMTKAADVDNSGALSISDLSRLNQYLNGGITKLVN